MNLMELPSAAVPATTRSVRRSWSPAARPRCRGAPVCGDEHDEGARRPPIWKAAAAKQRHQEAAEDRGVKSAIGRGAGRRGDGIDSGKRNDSGNGEARERRRRGKLYRLRRNPRAQDCDQFRREQFG